MKTVYLFLFFLLFQPSVQQSFSIPSGLKELPVTYLNRIKVNDTSRQLNEAEREQLVRLFVWAYTTSVRNAGQDYALEVEAPIYKLLKTNFPSVAGREGEGGIMLREITHFFNRMPEYEKIVNSELEKRSGRIPCKQ
jgi:hypothetical protein